MITCDICDVYLEEGYKKIIADTYGICENPECEKEARKRARRDLQELLETGDIRMDEILRYEEFFY